MKARASGPSVINPDFKKPLRSSSVLDPPADQAGRGRMTSTLVACHFGLRFFPNDCHLQTF